VIMSGRLGVIYLARGTDANGFRFHAWQSSLLFTAIFVLHLIFSWSSFLSWVLFIADIGLIGFLTLRAYRDGEWLGAGLFIKLMPMQQKHWTDLKCRSSESWRAVYWMMSENAFGGFGARDTHRHGRSDCITHNS
jgi:uncharacterized membrane protein